jgi:hypothetical protein
MAEKKKKTKINPNDLIAMPPLPMVLVNAENDRKNAVNKPTDPPVDTSESHPVGKQDVKKIIEKLNKEKE